MILPDVNLLLHAYNQDSPYHGRARAWWEEVLSGTELVALAWVTILGFVRITTNRAAFSSPVPLDAVLAAVHTWLTHPNVRVVHPDPPAR